MCDQPRSEARSLRREDEEARKKDREEMNKGQSYSWHGTALRALDTWHQTTLCAPDSTGCTGQGTALFFSTRHTFVFWA